MNKEKSLLKFQFFSLILSLGLGILLHFTYNLSGNNALVSLFSSVNESTWEHLKLIFFPMFLTTIIGYFYFGNKYGNFLCARTLSILIAMLFTIVFFYTYTGILGKNIAFIDISSFFISVILGEYLTYKFINSNIECNNNISIIILIFLFILFAIFTFNPPNLGLFKAPLTGSFGVK